MHYIQGEKESPMFYASYGSFIHTLLQRYYDGILSKEELPTAFLLGFSSSVGGERPAQSTVAKYIVSGRGYFEKFEPLPYKIIGIEQELHFDLDGSPFVAFLDIVGEKDGKLVVVDHKSRELKQRSNRKKPTLKDKELDGMLRQLYLYAHGVKQVYGDFPSILCFNCFRNGELIEEQFNEKAYIEALDWAKTKIEEITDEEDFRPYVDYFQCKYLCGLHDKCCFWKEQ